MHQQAWSLPAPSHQPSPGHPHTFAIGIHDVLTGPPTPASWGTVCCSGRTGATTRRSCIRPRRRSTGSSGPEVHGGLRQGRPERLCATRRRAASGPDYLAAAALPSPQRHEARISTSIPVLMRDVSLYPCCLALIQICMAGSSGKQSRFSLDVSCALSLSSYQAS
jgi:hypothetical protein